MHRDGRLKRYGVYSEYSKLRGISLFIRSDESARNVAEHSGIVIEGKILDILQNQNLFLQTSTERGNKRRALLVEFIATGLGSRLKALSHRSQYQFFRSLISCNGLHAAFEHACHPSSRCGFVLIGKMLESEAQLLLNTGMGYNTNADRCGEVAERLNAAVC